MSAAETQAVIARLRARVTELDDLGETYMFALLAFLAYHAPEVVRFAMDRVDARTDASLAGREEQ